jgi:hypothetical protein
MSTNETPALTLLPREGNGPINYRAPREQHSYAKVKLTKLSTQNCIYIWGSILLVRYTPNMATAIGPEALAHAVLSMAAHCPAMRDDLIARLTAQVAAEAAR